MKIISKGKIHTWMQANRSVKDMDYFDLFLSALFMVNACTKMQCRIKQKVVLLVEVSIIWQFMGRP